MPRQLCCSSLARSPLASTCSNIRKPTSFEACTSPAGLPPRELKIPGSGTAPRLWCTNPGRAVARWTVRHATPLRCASIAVQDPGSLFSFQQKKVSPQPGYVVLIWRIGRPTAGRVAHGGLPTCTLPAGQSSLGCASAGLLAFLFRGNPVVWACGVRSEVAFW